MKKTLQLVLSLTLISAVCAAVLAIVNAATKERIANLATLKANAAARAVLPAAVKAIDSRTIPGDAPGDAEITVFVGYADDAKTQLAGYAVPGLSKKGYGGAIQLMVGLNPDRTVVTYQVLAAGETPGLGSNLTTPAFIARFKDQPAANVKVTKDGGQIEALTSATITSRAVCDAVANAAQRIDRMEGKDTGATSAPAPAVNPEGKDTGATSAPAPAVNPEGKMLFDPSKTATGYAAVGTGKATGPHGDLVIIYQFGFTAKRAPSFNPPPRMVNQPAIEMTDMENAQRTAYNAALQDALSQLR